MARASASGSEVSSPERRITTLFRDCLEVLRDSIADIDFAHLAGDGIRAHDLPYPCGLEFLHRLSDQQRMRTDGDDPSGAGLPEDYPRSSYCSTRTDYVVDYEDVSAIHLQLRRFDPALPCDPFPLLGELDEHRLEEGGEGFRPFGPAEVGGDHDGLIQLKVLLHVADQARDR